MLFMKVALTSAILYGTETILLITLAANSIRPTLPRFRGRDIHGVFKGRVIIEDVVQGVGIYDAHYV